MDNGMFLRIIYYSYIKNLPWVTKTGYDGADKVQSVVQCIEENKRVSEDELFDKDFFYKFFEVVVLDREKYGLGCFNLSEEDGICFCHKEVEKNDIYPYVHKDRCYLGIKTDGVFLIISVDSLLYSGVPVMEWKLNCETGTIERVIYDNVMGESDQERNFLFWSIMKRAVILVDYLDSDKNNLLSNEKAFLEELIEEREEFIEKANRLKSSKVLSNLLRY